MSDPFVAEIRIFAGDFAPKGWATCDGQLLPLSQNTALFSLLGTYYGGDGKSNFALPNLQGSAALGAGQGSNLSERFLGEQGGAPAVTLTTQEMPVHSHLFNVSTEDGTQGTLTDSVVLGKSTLGQLYQSAANVSPTTLNPQVLQVTGANLAHENRQPSLVVLFIIAMQGVYPPRG